MMLPFYKIFKYSKMECVLLAGGEGKRMRPLTLTKPKPMLSVAGKPILQINLEILAKLFREKFNQKPKIYIVVGYKKDVVMSYFGDKFKTSDGGVDIHVDVEYIEQKEQLGTGNAILTLKGKVRDKFIVMNGDILIGENAIRNFINLLKPCGFNLSKSKDFEIAGENNKENVMCLTKVENPSDYGVVEIGKDNTITTIEEKPKNPKSNLVNAGIYLFEEKIFDLIESLKKSERQEYEITDAIKILIKDKKIYGYTMDDGEVWMDIGRPWDLLSANENLLKNIDKKIYGNVEDGVIIKNNVIVDEGTEILSGSYIIGPCYIGKNCKIGPNTIIRPYTSIGNNCHIGSAVEVKNTIIGNNSNVPHLSYVGDSIIGENCNLAAGTLIANLRHDDANVKVNINGNVIDSKRRKLGVIMADDVKTGINTSILPGAVIYPNSWIQSHSMIDKIYPF